MKQLINEDQPIISISVAADLLGIHVRTLMLYDYERLMIPRRSPTNRRMYSQNDLKDLQFIQFLTRKKGINLAGVKIILKMIKEAKNSGIDLKASLFPDFVEKID